MYLDKLDGRIDTTFFDSKSAEWRTEQDRLLRDVATHQTANQTYIEEGVQLLQLAHRAARPVPKAGTRGKTATPEFYSRTAFGRPACSRRNIQPFDILALAREAGGGDEAMSGTKNGQFENWLPGMDSNHDSRLQRPLSYH